MRACAPDAYRCVGRGAHLRRAAQVMECRSLPGTPFPILCGPASTSAVLPYAGHCRVHVWLLGSDLCPQNLVDLDPVKGAVFVVQGSTGKHYTVRARREAFPTHITCRAVQLLPVHPVPREKEDCALSALRKGEGATTKPAQRRGATKEGCQQPRDERGLPAASRRKRVASSLAGACPMLSAWVSVQILYVTTPRTARIVHLHG
jgi:hypothetical protein